MFVICDEFGKVLDGCPAIDLNAAKKNQCAPLSIVRDSGMCSQQRVGRWSAGDSQEPCSLQVDSDVYDTAMRQGSDSNFHREIFAMSLLDGAGPAESLRDRHLSAKAGHKEVYATVEPSGTGCV